MRNERPSSGFGTRSAWPRRLEPLEPEDHRRERHLEPLGEPGRRPRPLGADQDVHRVVLGRQVDARRARPRSAASASAASRRPRTGSWAGPRGVGHYCNLVLTFLRARCRYRSWPAFSRSPSMACFSARSRSLPLVPSAQIAADREGQDRRAVRSRRLRRGLDLDDRPRPRPGRPRRSRRRTPSPSGSRSRAGRSASPTAPAASGWPTGRRTSSARINPRTNRVVKRITIGFSTYGVGFGAGSVWTTSEADGTVRRISPAKNRVVAKIKVGQTPNGVVVRLRRDLGRRPREGHARPDRPEDEPRHEADRRREGRLDHAVGRRALGLDRGGADRARSIPRSGAVVAKIGVGANPLGSAWVGGELWVPNLDGGTISVVDPATNAVRTTLEVGSGPLSVASAAGDAWISNSNDGELWRVDPARARSSEKLTDSRRSDNDSVGFSRRGEMRNRGRAIAAAIAFACVLAALAADDRARLGAEHGPEGTGDEERVVALSRPRVAARARARKARRPRTTRAARTRRRT